MHIKRRLQPKRCTVIREIRRETDGADIETPADPLERSVPMKGLTFPAVNAGKRLALTATAQQQLARKHASTYVTNTVS